MMPFMKKTSRKQYSSYGYSTILFIAFTFFTLNFGFGQSDISIDSPTAVAEGDAGPAQIDFTVSIDASDPLADITVDYAISGGNED
ncbi:MAG: hypothetical protein AB3N18_14410, partial [Allomuricauda sp.]